MQRILNTSFHLQCSFESYDYGSSVRGELPHSKNGPRIWLCEHWGGRNNMIYIALMIWCFVDVHSRACHLKLVTIYGLQVAAVLLELTTQRLYGGMQMVSTEYILRTLNFQLNEVNATSGYCSPRLRLRGSHALQRPSTVCFQSFLLGWAWENQVTALIRSSQSPSIFWPSLPRFHPFFFAHPLSLWAVAAGTDQRAQSHWSLELTKQRAAVVETTAVYFPVTHIGCRPCLVCASTSKDSALWDQQIAESPAAELVLLVIQLQNQLCSHQPSF